MAPSSEMTLGRGRSPDRDRDRASESTHVQTNPRPTLISKLARVALNLAGWRLLEQPLPGPRGIILAYPHTSNWDLTQLYKVHTVVLKIVKFEILSYFEN